jgi:short-subunit dehydrogenase
MAKARGIEGMAVAITGASAGIGAALARSLASKGARLALCARRLERLREVAPAGHLCVQADVSVPEDCARFIAESQRALGRIDTLVCNAGYGFVRPIADTSAADWDALLRTNLIGTVACITAALPEMRAHSERDGWRGQVMIVSSALARRASPIAGAYSATKAAQLSVAEALRIELAPARIAVTSVHPVHTETEFHDVAARVSAKAWSTSSRDPVQSAEVVAEAMARAIAKPRAEVWPHRLSRLAFAAAGFIPGIVDGVIRRRYQR